MTPALFGALCAIVLLGGALVLGLVGATRRWTANDWRLSATSALLYTLAFNLMFFVQELFLVLPKAMTPGLQPTLYHNNHNWEGDNLLAELLQGTGALAIFIAALGFAFWQARFPARSAMAQLFLIWLAFAGLFQSLPQVVLGAVFPPNDVGRALAYLELPFGVKAAAAIGAIVVMIASAFWLTRRLLALAPPERAATPAGRALYVFRAATLPSLIALPLIVLFRVPGSIDQVLIVPLAVALIGISWMQASAWLVTPRASVALPPMTSLWAPLMATAVLLAIFQIVLRPGIDFF